MSKLTHLDEQGAARMVDVSTKDATEREAAAEAVIVLSVEAFGEVIRGAAKKGDVLAAARIAGIMAAKRTSDLIPLCHPVAVTKASIEFEPDTARSAIRITSCVKTTGQTGVEMEALVAVSIAALTIYDMVKSVDREAVIERILLLSKSGGKSGKYVVKASKARKPTLRSTGVRSHPSPSTLIGEVTTPLRHNEPTATREAFRRFMTSRHLRATQWSKEAGVPTAQIYAYLTGKTRNLPDKVAERLAHAANSRVEDMFR